MEFEEFRGIVQKHIDKMLTHKTYLYTVDIDKDMLWNTYLDAFPPGTNKVYRERREYDCGACRQFIKSFGNVVVIEGVQIVSIWDFTIDDPVFSFVVGALSRAVHGALIGDVFGPKESTFGTEKNVEILPSGTTTT